MQFGVSFSIGNYGYFGTGDSAYYIPVTCYHNSKPYWWQYDPNTNTWTQMANYGGGKREWSVGFSIGCKGYVCCGEDETGNIGKNKKDFWEFIPPAPSASLAGINTICAGQSTHLFASGGLFYHWNTNAVTNVITVTPTVTTTYSVIVSDSCGSDAASTTVTVITNPVANFSLNQDLCMYCVKLTDQSINTFLWKWSFGDTATSIVQNPSHCYTDTGTYFISLVSSTPMEMCRDTFKTSVHFYNADETKIIIPNVFTPNGDGNNDVFIISGSDNCSHYKIQIFDRWGMLVFESEQTGFVWDGRTDAGIVCEEGTYYYVLSNNTTTKKGFVTLLR